MNVAQTAAPLRPTTSPDIRGTLSLSPAIGVRKPYERNLPVHAVFEQRAASTPRADAIVDINGTVSYAELNAQANRLARHLHSVGVRPGDSVGVGFERSRQLPVALLAILKAGCAYVPLDASYPPERIAFMIADASIAVIIVDRSISQNDGGYGDSTVVDLDAHAAAIATESELPLAVNLPSDARAYVMYTSGSTGRPKGVAIGHRGVVRLVLGADYFAVAPNDTFLHFAPAAFDASTFEVWAPLLNGARLGIPRAGLLSIDDLGAAVERFGVTTMFLTTSLFQRLSDSKLPAFNILRHLLTGGEVASPAHMLRFLQTYPACRLAAVYGPTENTTFSTWCELPDAAAIGSSVPIGRPIANSTAYVVDADLSPIAVGEIGELCVGGDGIALGYVNLPGKTAERFVPDPFSDTPGAMMYRTGDLARFRADGLLEFHGRTDNQVKIHGFRIELGEIEVVLRAHSQVRDAAVVTIELEPGEKTLSAHIVLAPNSALDEKALRIYLRRKLPAYMVPARIALADELPLHPSGKIDRVTLAARTAKSLPHLAAQQSREYPQGDRITHRTRPLNRTALVQAVAEIWREVLHLDGAPDVNLNFFDAGGDSLHLLRLRTLLNERLDCNVSIMDLFESTTVRRMAELITTSRR